MGSTSQLGFINHWQSHPNPTSVSPKEELSITAPVQREKQGHLGRVGSRLPSWQWLSTLSSSTAPCFPPARPRALSTLHQMSQNPGRAEAEVQWDGCVSRNCTGSRGSSPESKKHKFPVPSAGGKHSPFPQILGASRRAVSSGMGVCHTWLAASPVGQGPWGPPVHPQGFMGQKQFCTLMCALLHWRNLGSPIAWPRLLLRVT